MPPPPPGAPGPFVLSTPGALEALAAEAGLAPQLAGDVTTRWDFPDHATAIRGLLSAGPAVKAIAVAGEARVAEAVSDAIAPFATGPAASASRTPGAMRSPPPDASRRGA
jgi:hypothetical protein